MSNKDVFSSFDRRERKSILSQEEYDLVIIGGGATGCGIALDAASRGLKTALVEKRDFASGTSSKSTKLIHDGTFGKYSTALGLWVYDFLADVDKKDRRVMLSKKKTLDKEPLLDPSTLKGAGYYAEYRTDDARLTIELIKKAAAYGALAINYLEVTGFDYEGDRISGVACADLLDQSKINIRAKKIVAAGGPWVDKLRGINNSVTDKRLRLTKGVHIVVQHERLPLKQSVYFDVPDGRMIFAIPRGKVTYIGTTDKPYTGSIDRVVATEADRDYLLKAVNNTFPTANITSYHVISNWAGLRPLIHEDGKSPSELSRKDEIFVATDGLIAIAGGKLTGYRKMAERIVDMVHKQLAGEQGIKYKKATTKSIALTPEPLKDNKEVQAYIEEISNQCQREGLDKSVGWYLVTNYGRQASNILKNRKQYDQADPEINLALAELDFCLKYEMIQRAEDYFVRRTGRLYFDILSIDNIKESILQKMSEELDWSTERLYREREILDSLMKDATHYYKDERVEALTDDILEV